VRLPVEEIAAVARSRGALTVLDAYQAAGSIPLDVEALGVDVLAGGRPEVPARVGRARVHVGAAGLDLVPTQTGWFADEDIFKMDHRDYSPDNSARRFQSGTPPVPAIYGGIAGIELMLEIGVAETREHVNALNERLIAVSTSWGAPWSRRARRSAAER
jgi:Selenocysteine lyase